MEHVIEHPHRNATKTVTIEPVKLKPGLAYRIKITIQNYSGQASMYSEQGLELMLFEEELDGLITALNKAKMAKLLGIK